MHTKAEILGYCICGCKISTAVPSFWRVVCGYTKQAITTSMYGRVLQLLHNCKAQFGVAIKITPGNTRVDSVYSDFLQGFYS